MTWSPAPRPGSVERDSEQVERLDAVVIGAGLSGLYQLYCLREAGLTVRCFEEGSGVGGTWYWNRYPGCAFDTPSETYMYSFSDELSQEWEWKHYFAQRPEVEAYLNHVADRFHLRASIEFDSRVTSATWNEDEHVWEIQLEGGKRVSATYLLPAVGSLSTGVKPLLAGADRFRGEQYHTSRWPREDPTLTGKHVAVIGTGATAVQLIPHLAKLCGQLTVFQRTPNYCVPSENREVDPEDLREWRENFREIREQVRHGFGMRVTMDPRNARDVPRQERLALYEHGWSTQRGAEKFMVLFHDFLSDFEILEEYSEFVRGKIRARIEDPVMAEKLVPTDHLFMAKRVPTETHYYEAFNRCHVALVDVRETPIECVTENGLRTTNRDYEFDVIVYATGFDGVTGTMTRIDIRGVGGRTLKQKWDEEGLRSYLGLMAAGFPNLFISCIPCLSAAAPPGVEASGDWFRTCIAHMRTHGYTRVEASSEAEEEWMQRYEEAGKIMVFGNTDSWYVGSNVPGKKRQLLIYCKPAADWRAECYEVIEQGFVGLEFGRGSDRRTSAAVTGA